MITATHQFSFRPSKNDTYTYTCTIHKAINVPYGYMIGHLEGIHRMPTLEARKTIKAARRERSAQ